MSITLAAEGSKLGPSGLLFLFAKGQRPTRRDLLALIGNSGGSVVSHDPAELEEHEQNGQSEAGEAHHWLELLRDGLTFDLLGLAGGPALEVPPIAQRLGNTFGLTPDDVEAMGLFPGPHLAEGAASLPIVRTQLALAIDLIDGLPGLLAMLWTPAAVAIDPPAFDLFVREWLQGGAFPSFALVKLEVCKVGEPQTRGLQTLGLSFFTGQEIEMAPSLSRNRMAGIRLALRVIDELIVLGKIESPVELGIDRRRVLRLTPSEDGTLVLVERA
jgi:hypothetical protein